MILDMLCHWRYVLDNTFGNVKSVSCLGATHIPERIDEDGKRYKATADDAAYATFQLDGNIIAHFNCSWATRVRRDDLLTLHVDGTHGSAVAGLQDVVTQQRMATPKPVWNPDVKQPIDFYAGWQPVPETQAFDNGFKLQWEAFIRHVVRGRALQVGPDRRRQGRAARRVRAAELEGAPLGRRAGAEGLICHPGSRCFVPRSSRQELGTAGSSGDLRSRYLAPTWEDERQRATHMNAPILSSLKINLPTDAGQARDLRAVRAARLSRQGQGRLQPRRLLGRARGGRCARRQRSLDRLRARLGQDASPTASTSGTSASASPRRWTRPSAAWGSTGRPRSS